MRCAFRVTVRFTSSTSTWPKWNTLTQRGPMCPDHFHEAMQRPTYALRPTLRQVVSHGVAKILYWR